MTTHTLFTLNRDEEGASDTVDLDELFEHKKHQDLLQLDLYTKMLHRVHAKIKLVSRQRIPETWCWFVVPERIFGVPRYNQASCVTFVMDKLTANRFLVEYIHPGVLLITWNHVFPSYVRQELKKKTGITIDEVGHLVENDNDDGEEKEGQPSSSSSSSSHKKKSDKEKSVPSYQPSGRLVYPAHLVERLSQTLAHAHARK